MASPSDHRLARVLATEAGQRLMQLRASIGDDPDRLRREGDRQSHQFLSERLAALAGDDVVLSEEGADDPARLGAPRVWVVDPLDGTREYGETGRVDWAVHVALVEAGVPTAGAVALPGRNMTLATDRPPRPAAARPSQPRLVVSRSRPTPLAGTLAEALGGNLVPLGSAGAKAMAVVLGEAEVYAHSGGQYEWDSAAPVAVAAAAGLHCSRLDGSPLRYNQVDLFLPDLLVCVPELAEQVLGVARGRVAG